ncbi:MAG: hypothetical protein WBP08_11165, partial [Saprospiraceae bacterium]
NRLLGTIDPKNTIKELPNPEGENNNELYTNNQKGFEFFVTDNYATAIYPPDFAMINTKDHFILKASTSSVPVKKGNYIFQIDTTAYFNSPIKETGKVESEGGLITFQPKLALVADRVYYWRVSPDSTISEGYKWSSASFAYLPGEDEGWNQSHFFQFQQNEFTDLELSEETGRKFEFGNIYRNIKIRNKLWDIDDKPGYSHNNILFASSLAWEFLDAGIGIILNNQVNFWEPIVPSGGAYGSFNPTGNALDVYAFKTNSAEDRKKVMDFIENQVKGGKYMSFYTIQKNTDSDYKPKDWALDSLIYGKSLFTVLEKLGAQKVRELERKGSVPYILQLYNGKEGVLSELVANSINDIIENTARYYNKNLNGNSKSSSIGPTIKWDNLKFNYIENQGLNEKASLNIYGITNLDVGIKIDSNLQTNKILNIDDKSFKAIKVESITYDSLERTSPQLKFWRVSYSSLPDASISYIKSEPNFSSNEIKQGEKVKIFYDVTNVNFVSMDSVLVKYTYIGSDNHANVNYKKLGKLLSGQKISDMIEFNIGAGNITDVRLIIEINPDNNQPELNLFNNTLTVQFGVKRDQTNP